MAEPTATQRRALAKMGIAMPDGSYYIRNADDLQNAIESVGRATPNAGESDVARRNAVRRHVIARAKALKLESKIPASWNPDGSLKQSAITEDLLSQFGEDELVHFGRRGMKWGEHIFGRDRGGDSSHPVSEDAARARASQATARKHGASALSNADLQHLVTRLNLERQHGNLDPKPVSLGQKIVHETLKIGGDVAKQQATAYAAKYAAKGLEELVKKAA